MNTGRTEIDVLFKDPTLYLLSAVLRNYRILCPIIKVL